VYLWLTAVFVTCLVMANVLGVKLFSFGTGFTLGDEPFRIEHTVGMLPFPITFLLTDLLNEYFGPKAARRVTYIGFAMALLAFVLISIARRMPTLEGIPGTADSKSFEIVFGSATLMYVASLAAFVLGSLLDIFIFGVFKNLTQGRLIWLRATGSTVISQLFDSFIVTWLFFWMFPMLLGQEHATWGFVLKTAATGYVLKFCIAVGMTPVIYAGRWILSGCFGLVPIQAASTTGTGGSPTKAS